MMQTFIVKNNNVINELIAWKYLLGQVFSCPKFYFIAGIGIGQKNLSWIQI